MEITKDYLYTLTVYDLRVLGRELGVRAPTTKSRKILIYEILEINSGVRAPYFKDINSKGRPAKSGKLNQTVIKKELKPLQGKELEIMTRIEKVLDECKYKIIKIISEYK